MKIVTLQDQNKHILLNKTRTISSKEATSTISKLEEVLIHLFENGPIAGLAANQIGIDQSVFAFSPNRSFETLEYAINPELQPIGNKKTTSWEACLSCKYHDGSSQAALVSRYAKIEATYTDKHGNKVKKELDGFAAKVFQHEYDHLQGIVNVNRPEAIVKSFSNKNDFEVFMSNIRKEDAKKY